MKSLCMVIVQFLCTIISPYTCIGIMHNIIVLPKLGKAYRHVVDYSTFGKYLGDYTNAYMYTCMSHVNILM